MIVFATFQEASEAARRTAVERQQNVFVFRVLDGSWSIWMEDIDMQNSYPAVPEPASDLSILRILETVSAESQISPF